MRSRRNIFEDIDWITVFIYAVLAFFGWVCIYSATFSDANIGLGLTQTNHGKQMLFMIISSIVAIAILFLDHRFFETLAYGVYGLGLALLLLVLVFGSEIKGAQSWFVMGPISFQPSEIAKYGTALALAKFISANHNTFNTFQTRLKAAAIIGMPAALIMLQPDVGSMLVFTALSIVLYREGLSGWFFVLGFIAIILFISALYLKQYEWVIFGTLIKGKIAFITFMVLLSGLTYYIFRKAKGSLLIISGALVAMLGFFLSVDYVFDNVLKVHHQNRINELLGIVSDPKGAGYNVHQSMIAFGSGGFSGRGFLEGTQTQLKYVPEQFTDFIFSTLGEEWGFLGTFLVISLFVFLMARIIWLSEKQRSVFTRIYGYSVASIFFIHFAINIGMTIGLAPVIGIPLPFFSYGGSSLLSFTLLLFTFIKLDSERKFVLR